MTIIWRINKKENGALRAMLAGNLELNGQHQTVPDLMAPEWQI